MALNITNISEKVIGFGSLAVLPGETVEVPFSFEQNPILGVYKNMGIVTISGNATSAGQADAEKGNTETEKNEDTTAKKADAEKEDKLAALKDASDEDVAKQANELGINPAECKDQSDVRKKVKAALSK